MSSLRVSRIYRNKGKNYQKRLKKSVKVHLGFCDKIRKKLGVSLLEIKGLIEEAAMGKEHLTPLYEDLILFMAYFDKHVDLVTRRILLEEKIPHEEKIFSLHEPHTEWISKGKSNKKVELGHAVCITTNQEHFCLHWQVMEKQVDVDMPLIIKEFIQENYAKYRIASWSFDRNFGSKENREELSKVVDYLVMPKKGKVSKKEREKLKQKEYSKYKRQHATVEANINQLECLGAGKCRDKGIEGFKRYVGLSVLAYNLHRVGKKRKPQ
ncbi:transposase (IS4 family) protein [Microscilla marina ATCC 23134]|uniref:Transposase (IS4 family) protein n=2 Tax=Microscilla marina TaxID=1027 RepID=A1ZVB2_MICM2|nr:transposase (IS4 family) protein [Microscilla marina ATCC 23134]